MSNASASVAAQPAASASQEGMPVVDAAAPSKAGGRNLTADGLRGVAAMLVVIYHLYLNTESALQPHLPGWLHGLIRTLGGTGVSVFFVLSGFVIAMSLRSAQLSGRFIALFALRRSIRLDPPYWAAMVMCMVLAQVSARVTHQAPTAYSVPQVLAHLVYLQDILGYPQISAVFWTLCIELQFYLTLVCLLMLGTRTAGTRGAQALVLTLAALSLAIDVANWALPVKGLFVPHWHMFSLGVVTCWCLFKDLSWRWWAGFMALELALVFGTNPSPATLGPVLAAALLVASSYWQPAGQWLHTRLAQYLGRLSYSLYLTHPTIGWSTISLLKKLFGDQSFALGLVYVAVGIVTSVISAHLLYRLVEAPAVRWSKKVPLPRTDKPGTGH